MSDVVSILLIGSQASLPSTPFSRRDPDDPAYPDNFRPTTSRRRLGPEATTRTTGCNQDCALTRRGMMGWWTTWALGRASTLVGSWATLQAGLRPAHDHCRSLEWLPTARRGAGRRRGRTQSGSGGPKQFRHSSADSGHRDVVVTIGGAGRVELVACAFAEQGVGDLLDDDIVGRAAAEEVAQGQSFR